MNISNAVEGAEVKELVATVTERGQLTLPAEVRRLLGIEPRQKVAFLIEDDQVRLVPVKYTLESAFGSVPPLNRPENFEQIIEEAMDEHAQEVVREMRRR